MIELPRRLAAIGLIVLLIRPLIWGLVFWGALDRADEVVLTDVAEWIDASAAELVLGLVLLAIGIVQVRGTEASSSDSRSVAMTSRSLFLQILCSALLFGATAWLLWTLESTSLYREAYRTWWESWLHITDWNINSDPIVRFAKAAAWVATGGFLTSQVALYAATWSSLWSDKRPTWSIVAAGVMLIELAIFTLIGPEFRGYRHG